MKTPAKDNRKNPTNLYTIFKKNFKSDPKKQRLIAGPGINSAKSRLNGACGEDAVLTVRMSSEFFRETVSHFKNGEILQTIYRSLEK